MNTTESLIERIAQHEHLDLAVCRQAVEKVVDYYRPSGYQPHHLVNQLERYITNGENNRYMVMQFRQYVQEFTPVQA